MSAIARTDRSLIGHWWWTVDRGMLAALIAPMLFGVILVAAAGPAVARHIGADPSVFILKHVFFLGVALAAMLVSSAMSERMLWRGATILLAGGLAAMALVPFIGAEFKGAQRWIHLFGLSVQPSEFVKPAFVLAAAWLMLRERENPDFPGTLIGAGLYLLIVWLLMLQPDFGTAVLLTAVFAAQIFLAGLRFRYLAIFGAAAIAGMLAVYAAFDHVRSRIDRFLNPESGDSYQIEQAMNAFGNGGLFGAGPGQGAAKIRLPDAHADFIFAVAGEEMGLIFVLVLIALFAFILFRGLSHLAEASSIFAVIGGGGLLVMFALQAFVHMGSNLHLLPTKGMTLPFISYGGSSMVATGLSMGAVLALTRTRRRAGIARRGLLLGGRAAA